MNEHELSLAAKLPSSASDDQKAQDILSRGVEAVVLTLGAQGAKLYEKGVEPVSVAAVPTEVVDTTGAGDAFVGALAAALAGGDSLDIGIAKANVYAARVCAVMGAQTAPVA